MATIKVKFRPSINEEREGRIYYQVTHERKPRQVRTEYKIFPSEWNEQRMTLTCNENSSRISVILEIRRRIRIDLERFRRVIKACERLRLDYTSDDIVAEYERMSKENSLFTYMNNLIETIRMNGKIRTSEAYKSAMNSFLKFREGKDIMLEYLDKEIMASYEAWLKQKSVSPNTISFYIRILRAVYNRAVDEELTENRKPFRKVYTGIEKTIKRALPIKLIKKIRRLDLSFNSNLEYARDMFILSFMLRGMSLIDMAFLRKSDLQNGQLTYRRRKTGQLLTVQWTPEMQEIINKYPSKDTGYLLPIIQNPRSKPSYAFRNVSYKINQYLRSIASQLDLPIALTMYVARHSWASAARAKGIPISVISEGLGHDSKMTTLIYLSTLDTSAVDRANAKILKML